MEWAGLCGKCSKARVMEGRNREIWCGASFAGEMRVDDPPSRCSMFHARDETGIHDMREIAWLINSDKKTGKIGFVSPLDREKERGQ